MAQLKDLLVNGPSRFIGDVFINSLSILDTFKVGANGKYFQAGSQGITLGDGSAAEANPANLVTVNGHVVINADKNTTNSYNEGLRINNGSSNWSCVALGGDSNTLGGRSKSVWAIAIQRHDTTNKVSNFYIANNGSSGAGLRLTGHATNEQPTLGFSIRPRLSIGRDPDVNYTLLVGTSDATTNNISVFNGRAVINPSYTSETSNTYCHGLRINRTGGNNGGKSQVVLGGTQGSLSGAPVGVWTLGVESNPADATSTVTKTAFYIAHQGVGGFNPNSNAYIRGTYGTNPIINKLEIMFPETYASNLYPNTDNTYDLGSSSNKWKNIFGDRFSGLSGGADYLTCPTQAAIAEKVVTLDNYVLNTGSSIYIKFIEQNTAASPTLDINSTGAKSIYYKGVQVKSRGLEKDIIYHMIYDGTNWVIINDLGDKIPYGVSTTASGTSPKSLYAEGYIEYPGAKVDIMLTNENLFTSTAQIKINYYDQHPIYYNGIQLGTSTNKTALGNNIIYHLQYDATNLCFQVLDVETNLGICQTAAGTKPKTVSIPGYTSQVGEIIKVKFDGTNTNTDLLLNVNSEGQKQIYYKGVRVNGSALISDFIYKLRNEGTQWEIINEDLPLEYYGKDTVTTSSTKARVIDCPGYIPYDNSILNVYFPYSISSSTGISFKISKLSTEYPVRIRNSTNLIGKIPEGRIYRFKYNLTENEFEVISDTFSHWEKLGVTAREAVTNPDTGEVVTPAVAEVVGEEIFELGKSRTSNTDGGSTGKLRLYGPTTYYQEIIAQPNTGNRTVYLPNYAGSMYLIHGENNNAIGSDNRPIYIAANGRATAITYIANRLYYPVTTASFNKGNHYVNDTKIAINSISEPTENFYVNGTAKISGAITLSGNITTAIAANSAVVTDANKKLTARSITNNTTATAVTASTNLITANTLYNHIGNSNITTVGTISSGTWQGTKVGTAYGGTGHTANYNAKGIVFATSATEFSSTAAGSSGQVLTSQGGGTKDPTWTSQSSLSVGTSASCSGNAATATAAGQWIDAQTVYVTLGTASTTTTIQGGSSTAQTIGVNGTLAIGNGGTGLTASPSMLTNLGSTTAANVLQASPRPGVTGTLATGNGGTGLASFTQYGIFYASSTSAMSQVANNTTSTKKFLTMTGTGSAGATPAWKALSLDDIPDAFILNGEDDESLGNLTIGNVVDDASLTIRNSVSASANKQIFLYMENEEISLGMGLKTFWNNTNKTTYLSIISNQDNAYTSDFASGDYRSLVTINGRNGYATFTGGASFGSGVNITGASMIQNGRFTLRNAPSSSGFSFVSEKYGENILSLKSTRLKNVTGTNVYINFSRFYNDTVNESDVSDSTTFTEGSSWRLGVFASSSNNNFIIYNNYTTTAGSFFKTFEIEQNTGNVTISKGILYAQNGLVIPTSAKANTENGAIWIA